jgi:hypothetical protein
MTEKSDSKQILVLMGSPRKKGNSAALALKIIESILDVGGRGVRGKIGRILAGTR